MNKNFSIYLDVIRFFAAMLVFVSHVPKFAGGAFWQISGFGHEAVIVFFVMSGFVIAFVIDKKKESLFEYTVNRVSRIYSVAIPALIITIPLYYLGLSINEDVMLSAQERMLDPVITIIRAITFTNQSWTAYSTFSNLPYWSMGYEVWYYIFFAVIVFTKSWKRVIFSAICLAFMGLSIVIYLPIWLFGVALFKLKDRVKINDFYSLILILITGLSLATLSINSVQETINNETLSLIGGFRELLLEPAHYFGSDYLMAIIFTLNLLGVYNLFKNNDDIKLNHQIVKVIRELSSHTFAIYLLHMPMLYFIAALIPNERYGLFNIFTCIFLVPIAIIAISKVIESNKNNFRNYLSKRMSTLFP